MTVGLIGLVLAVPPTVLAVRDLADSQPTAAERAGADGVRVVAMVNGSPITRSEFNHWLIVAKAGGTNSGKPAVDEALSFLISSVWLEQEARSRGIIVTPDEVSARFAELKEQQFGQSQASYQAFLHTTRQSEADLKFRVRQQLLTSKLQPVLQSEFGDLKTAAEEFADKWRPHTICASGFITKDCANA